MPKHLDKARVIKNDEFYTYYKDVETELQHYVKELKGKSVHCPCDDYKTSNFYKYLKDNFHKLGLKKLSCCSLGSNHCVFDGESEVVNTLLSDVDFRSVECVGILKDYDVIITNPPFSLLRDFIEILLRYDKDFITLVPLTSLSYNIIFNNLIIQKVFVTTSKSVNKFFNTTKTITCVWLNTFKELPKTYTNFTKCDYVKYDNSDIINVDRLKHIPLDYKGFMGVPITVFQHFNITRFKFYKILRPYINGKEKYNRVLVKNV